MKSEPLEGKRCEIDKNFRVLRCAGALARTLGYSDGEATGRKLFFGTEMVRALQEAGSYSGMAVILGANDIVYYAYVEMSATEEGYVVQSIEVRSFVNIDFWEKMFRKMPLPVMILSKDHTIVDLNDEMLKFVGRRREELLGTKCHTLMHHLSEPPGDCPLLDAVGKGMEHNLNIMDTVFGEFLISVVKIDDNLYAHYAVREVALLMNMQSRMMDFLKRYNRILIAATVINEEMLTGRDVDDIILSIGDKIRNIDGFLGAAIFVQKDGVWKECFSNNVSVSIDEIMRELSGERIRMIKRDGINYYVFTMHNAPRQAVFVLNMGTETLTNDEANTILSSIDHFGEYLASKILEEKRDMAYRYISGVMSDFAMLVDRIRNPLATLSLTVEMEIADEEIQKVMMDKIAEIQEITQKIDELWNRAEEMQKVLKGD